MSSQQATEPTLYDGRKTLMALFIALLSLVATELVFRTAAAHSSGNLAHIHDFGRLIEEFSVAEGKRVVFVGNSLTNNAISKDRFEAVAATLDSGPYATLKLVPDGTTIWDWRCIVDRLPPARSGDLLLLGYAWDQVTDQQTVRVDRTFGLVCPIGELLQTSSYAGLGVGDWLEAGLSHLSLLYVLRERVAGQILSRLIPHYKSEMQRINDEARESGRSSPAATRLRTYAALTELVQRARQLGYRTMIVAMPTVDGYATDPLLAITLGDLGVGYLDLRNLPQIATNHFVDSIHLGPTGAEIFTDVLVRQTVDSERPLSGM